MFGADALTRKFGETAPPEWVAALDMLNDAQLSNGLRDLVKSGKAYVPTLPEFIRHCKDARPPEPLQRPLLDNDTGDAWARAANRHLLAEVLKRRRVSEPQIRALLEARNRWAQDMRETDQGDGVEVEVQRAMWQFRMDELRAAA